MPFADINGGKIHYQIDGAPDAPVVVLSHSVGADLTMWNRQAAALSASFRVLRYDCRGHGRSSVTAGLYTIERLARDVVELLDALKIARVHFCGLSLGGMVGMWLGANAAERIDKLVLANTAAQLGPPEAWNTRIEAVRQGGMAVVADTVIQRWFTAEFRSRAPADIEAARQMILAAPPEGYMACCAAIRDMDQRAALPSIRARTLVIAGRDDPATPPAAGRAIADAIQGARFVELPASHISNVEAADAFTAAVLDFLLS